MTSLFIVSLEVTQLHLECRWVCLCWWAVMILKKRNLEWVMWKRHRIIMLSIFVVSITCADPKKFKGGGGRGWGGKFWKFSLVSLFKKIVFYCLLCFITLFYFWNLKGGGGATPVTPSRSANVLWQIPNFLATRYLFNEFLKKGRQYNSTTRKFRTVFRFLILL